MKTTDDMTQLERTLAGLSDVVHAQGDLLENHSALLEALNVQAARQTAHLTTIVDQLRRMNDGIIRALSAATRLDALEGRIGALERR
jgi:uncharacterized coiled-coil protein SlyX